MNGLKRWNYQFLVCELVLTIFVGLVVAGLATASNLGTQFTEFMLFRNMVKKVESLSKYDIELMHDIEDIYQKILNSDLVSYLHTR